MARVRSIAKPHQEGKHVTLAEARSAFRELKSVDTRRQIVPADLTGDKVSYIVGHKLELVTGAGRKRVGSKAKSRPKAR